MTRRKTSRIADGVWLVTGGLTGSMNVYMLEDGEGVTLFDAGIRSMVRQLRRAAERFGGIRRIVLGHAHADHRGAARGLGAPVLCHPDEKVHVESERGQDYFDLSTLDAPARVVMPRLLERWDGGPVPVAATLREGDGVAGFEVIHLPGHAPGLIGLFRAADGLMLSSDAFYTVDPQTGLRCAPALPHRAFNWDEGLARAALHKIIGLSPRCVWPGHAAPVTGDVAAQLGRAADPRS